MATDSNEDSNDDSIEQGPPDGPSTDAPLAAGGGTPPGGILIQMPIEDELKASYLTYAMSVIVSRALPDVRDGLKPSQRRILVAMNDLGLTPGASRVKCAKISGDTSGNYHPHGESVIYPTLVRMAQDWNMRHVLIDKQGNFGSIAGLPPAAMRYTEARLSPTAALMLEDLKLDTVDYLPTYDEQRTEPSVLPSQFPNLVVNGANGIAVGMATSIPPHNLGEVCDCLLKILDDPDVSVDELLEICPGPDFPTGGVICGRAGIRRGYHTGRGTVVVRARATIEEPNSGRTRIIIHEIPFQQARDRIEERIAALVNEGRIKGISGMRNESDLKEPVRLIIEMKRDADPEVVLNQLYQFSPLQDTFSLIFLALVDGKPRTLSFKGMLEEFLRHRMTVIRRRTQFLLMKARQRKHTVEGLLLAHANIDEVIRVIRASKNVGEAKQRIMQIECPAPLMQRALGDEGFAVFQEERGAAEAYTLTPVQADAILRMTLGQLVNLEQERLSDEHRELLNEIKEHLRILSDEENIRGVIREELTEIRRKHADPRRTEISGEEIGTIDLADLITEEPMVVTISHQGYIKRTPASVYRAQRRGGKGLKGARTEDEDPIAHLFAASTHDYLLFFTNKGRVYWQKVYDLPQLSRESRGRAVVNLLNLSEGEQIADCREVRNFDRPGCSLMMATRRGLVKKTELEAYSRPRAGGIIAIKLREGDELVDVVITEPGDEVVLATAAGMAIRFKESDARSMGRNSSGVKGVNLGAGDSLVGMVVAGADDTLLTATLNGYGKRTQFGPGENPAGPEPPTGEEGAEEGAAEDIAAPEPVSAEPTAEEGDESDEAATGSNNRYRTQRRGGKGLRDIKTTARNGQVIGIVRIQEEDEVLMISARGKIQRIRASDISVIGRNTQGVRIMSLDEADTLAAVVRVPPDANGGEGSIAALPAEPADEVAGDEPPVADSGITDSDATEIDGADSDS